MGGLAIFGGAIVAVLVIYRGRPPDQVLGILLALTVVALVGLWDDRNGLPAWGKLAGQLLGGIILIKFDVRVQLPLPNLLNYVITFLWLAGISNAINFLDNMDGLSAGVSAVAAAFMLLLGALNEQFLVAALAAAVLGACLGFLRYNFKPAQIFMGDTGSLALGAGLAVCALALRCELLLPFICLPFVIDAMSVVLQVGCFKTTGKRIFRMAPIHHGFELSGWLEWRVVIIFWLAGLASGVGTLYVWKTALGQSSASLL
ncbi:MAG: phospho-N-acetylmuramoyl-pentapeptide-transferase [Armatimonadetes bacterium CG_4_10_14_3_um_filter_59_10]|nr:MAG: phospho-N-acetylmuramoyl-pentapeptide-transferase [Armatimonadetes bacterium CG_4_10_14_3_um_filter_59_10]